MWQLLCDLIQSRLAAVADGSVSSGGYLKGVSGALLVLDRQMQAGRVAVRVQLADHQG
jgi:hypothetical protein